MDAALLPVKRLDEAKGRLSTHFSRAERGAIARALVRDAMELAVAATGLRWWVVTDDPEVIDHADGLGLGIVRAGDGLNRALRAGVRTVVSEGATSVTIIPADVPLATTADLEDVMDTGVTSDAVLVPSRRDGGTNALYMRPATLLEPRFGPGSLHAHVKAADDRSLRCSILPLERLSLDIDTVEDVEDLLVEADRLASNTVRVLSELRRASG